ncbi:MAG TPA: hypothetical protein VFE53_10940 [Mucilaginibacter sp.]|jgi:hypothetical protein|nr:hypothetical protein [Mucilaginibacter sp.]
MAFKSFLKALSWATVFFFIGIAQLAVTYILNLLRIDGHFNISNFFLNGFFLFLAISISGSIVYDFFIDAKIPQSPFWNKFGRFINFSLIIIFICIILFSMLLYASLYLYQELELEFKRDTLILCEQLILGVSLVLALGLKWIIYYHEIINNLK